MSDEEGSLARATASGAGFGVAAGVALLAITGEAFWLPMGLVFGAGVGVALHTAKDD